jgi:hypothetical protein
MIHHWMHNTDPFAFSRRKVARAKHHIRDLEK